MTVRVLRAIALFLASGLVASSTVAGEKPALVWLEGEAAAEHNFVPGPRPRAKCSARRIAAAMKHNPRFVYHEVPRGGHDAALWVDIDLETLRLHLPGERRGKGGEE